VLNDYTQPQAAAPVLSVPRLPAGKMRETSDTRMIAINAHYDGKVIVPDEPLDLPPNQALVVRIE
jgi:hypothetical protein